MGTILRNEIKRTRKGLFIWCLITGLIAYLGILEYPVLAPFTAELEKALAMIPKIGQLAFGVYNVNLGDSIGYYIVMYYWTGLIVFTHAIYTGVSMIMKEQRDRTSEFLYTKPITRREITTAKLLAGFFNIFVMGFVTVVLSLIGMVQATGDTSLVHAVLLSGIGLFLTQIVLVSLGFLCSALFKTYKGGTRVAILVLLASYCLMFVVQYYDLSSLNFLSPLTYFSVYDTTAWGLNPINILLAAVVTVVCVILTDRIYRKKTMVS